MIATSWPGVTVAIGGLLLSACTYKLATCSTVARAVGIIIALVVLVLLLLREEQSG